jgi:hypothetical protein
MAVIMQFVKFYTVEKLSLSVVTQGAKASH